MRYQRNLNRIPYHSAVPLASIKNFCFRSHLNILQHFWPKSVCNTRLLPLKFRHILQLRYKTFTDYSLFRHSSLHSFTILQSFTSCILCIAIYYSKSQSFLCSSQLSRKQLIGRNRVSQKELHVVQSLITGTNLVLKKVGVKF